MCFAWFQQELPHCLVSSSRTPLGHHPQELNAGPVWIVSGNGVKQPAPEQCRPFSIHLCLACYYLFTHTHTYHMLELAFDHYHWPLTVHMLVYIAAAQVMPVIRCRGGGHRGHRAQGREIAIWPPGLKVTILNSSGWTGTQFSCQGHYRKPIIPTAAVATVALLLDSAGCPATNPGNCLLNPSTPSGAHLTKGCTTRILTPLDITPHCLSFVSCQD